MHALGGHARCTRQVDLTLKAGLRRRRHGHGHHLRRVFALPLDDLEHQLDRVHVSRDRDRVAILELATEPAGSVGFGRVRLSRLAIEGIRWPGSKVSKAREGRRLPRRRGRFHARYTSSGRHPTTCAHTGCFEHLGDVTRATT